MNLQDVVEKTVVGLGYELVQIEHIHAGGLRITIDVIWNLDPLVQGSATATITVDDCEKVTRQLQYLFEVENIEYQRLEVSSPGLDRLMRGEKDFLRFCGSEIDITLKEAIGAPNSSETSGVVPNRKKFRGILEQVELDGKPAWQITWSAEAPPKPGIRVSKHKALPSLLSMVFQLDELKEARLTPIVSFKEK